MRAALVLLMVCVASVGVANAQRALLTGTVTDQSGSAIPGVHVNLLNLDQGLQRDSVTNENGYFTVPLLQPGRYVVTAQKGGFAVAEVDNVVLHVGDVRGLSIQLRVGAAPVQVQVSATAQQVETVSTALAQVVTGEVVRNAPLNGRDIRDLALLQPGVTPSDYDFVRNGVGTFNVAGSRSDSINYLLDGGLNNDLIDNRAVYNPNPDTVAEFRILTSNYPAEYGRNAGGIVSVATQSGTNQLHGSLFDFLRNDALDANSYFNKNAPMPLPRDALKRNQFGGTLGGPVTIPHLIKGKDRFFFFVGYQGERQVQDITLHNVPTLTPDEAGGKFSHSGPGGGPDPNVASFLASHPFFQADPLLQAEAIIDPNQINSVARSYLARGLIPTSPSGELTSSQPLTFNSDELTTKFDLDFDAKDKLAATVGWDRNHAVSPFEYADVPGFPDTFDGHDYFVNLAYGHFFSPNLLNEARFTYERSYNRTLNPAVQQPTPAELGIAITPDLPTGPTNLAFDNGLQIGFSTLGPQTFTDRTYSAQDTVTWIHGKHSWKFGGGFSVFRSNTDFAFTVNGQFVFVGQGNTFSGNSFADFLMGLPVQYTQSPAALSDVRSTFSFGFAQDEWRIRKNLSLSLGLRYEYSTPKSDSMGRTFSVVPGLQSTVFPNAPPGMLFPGDQAAPRGVNFPDRDNWAPRVGFAWDPKGNGKTSVRGAFGVFYDILKAEDNLQFNGQPPFYASAGFQFPPIDNPSTEVNYMPQPFEAVGAVNPFPSRPPPHDLDFASTGFLPIGSSGSVYIVDPHLQTPYTYQYHLTLQRGVTGNLVAQASYLGSSSHKLTTLQDINPFVLGSANRVLNLTAPGANCGVNAASLCYAYLREFRNAGASNYNGLLASLQKQFSGDGLFGHSYFTLAYTYSHNIDNTSGFQNRNAIVPSYDAGLFRASADMDVRHRIVFSGGWELPLQQAWKTAPKRLTGGWRVFPIVSWRSGFPLDVFANLASAFDYTSPGPSGAGDAELVHANLVGPIRILDPHRPGHSWFDISSFSNQQCSDASCVPGPGIFPSDEQVIANPSLRTYGTLARNAIRGPGRFNINLAFSKTTPINERLQVELRADFFNLLNHTEFANPDTNITSPTFGQVLDTAPPRVIQMALRLTF